MVKKVWLYILRTRAQEIELLVFDHLDVDAGTQIPAGTVELSEDITVAAQRELYEESGIRVEALTPLDVFERNWNGVDVQAHLFAAWAPPDVAEAWVHSVTGKGEDEGMRFRYYWLAHTEWNQLYGDFKLGYPALNQFIENTRTVERV